MTSQLIKFLLQPRQSNHITNLKSQIGHIPLEECISFIFFPFWIVRTRMQRSRRRFSTWPSEPAENTLLWLGAAANAFTSPLWEEYACWSVPCWLSQNWTLPVLSALTRVPHLKAKNNYYKQHGTKEKRLESNRLTKKKGSFTSCKRKYFDLNASNDQMQSSGPPPNPPRPTVILYISWANLASQHLINLQKSQDYPMKNTNKLKSYNDHFLMFT